LGKFTLHIKNVQYNDVVMRGGEGELLLHKKDFFSF